ncbi:RNA polymerase subunit sigma [Planctomicrobium sp. SH668]|uniref:RNA polymerase subunit sigma n=1 Tax=Planctomicrobium sp. SH668 TaxID=3448126 RepID=UPI003F5B5EDB
MSGPIIRTGATPEYWSNWDNVFGKKTKSASKAKEVAAAAPKKVAPAAKKAAAPKAAAPKAAPKKAAAKKAVKK